MEPLTVAVAAMAVSALSGFFAQILQRRTRRTTIEVKGEESLEARLARLGSTMQESARLLEQVSGEIDARAAAAAQLQREAREAEQLAQLNQAERDAVVRAVRAEIVSESKKSARQGLLANILFFIAGIAASIAVTLFVQPFG